MSREFGSLSEMALFLATRPAEIAIELHHGLDKLGVRLEKAMRAKFGEYQGAEGPFPAWAELADATKADRIAQGYPDNEPLLRSGETRDSFQHEVDHGGLELIVGSTDEKMSWFEFGTSKMPARPVVGPAAFASRELIQKLVGAAAVAGLIGHQAAADLGAYTETIDKGLGYEFETAD